MTFFKNISQMRLLIVPAWPSDRGAALSISFCWRPGISTRLLFRSVILLLLLALVDLIAATLSLRDSWHGETKVLSIQQP